MAINLFDYNAFRVANMDADGNALPTVEELAFEYLKSQSGAVKLEEIIDVVHRATFVDKQQLSSPIAHHLDNLAKKGKVTHISKGYWRI